MGATWSKERILGRFRSFHGVHGRGDVFLPQFIDGVVCMGSYRRGDPLWDIAHRRLQNTNGLRPLRSSPFEACDEQYPKEGLRDGSCPRSEEHTSELQSRRELVC